MIPLQGELVPFSPPPLFSPLSPLNRTSFSTSSASPPCPATRSARVSRFPRPPSRSSLTYYIGIVLSSLAVVQGVASLRLTLCFPSSHFYMQHSSALESLLRTLVLPSRKLPPRILLADIFLSLHYFYPPRPEYPRIPPYRSQNLPPGKGHIYVDKS